MRNKAIACLGAIVACATALAGIPATALAGPPPRPRMRGADIEVPNHPVDMDSWE